MVGMSRALRSVASCFSSGVRSLAGLPPRRAAWFLFVLGVLLALTAVTVPFTMEDEFAFLSFGKFNALSDLFNLNNPLGYSYHQTRPFHYGIIVLFYPRFGMEATGYRVIAALLYGLSVISIYGLYRTLAPERKETNLAAALLFVIATPAVSNVLFALRPGVSAYPMFFAALYQFAAMGPNGNVAARGPLLPLLLFLPLAAAGMLAETTILVLLPASILFYRLFFRAKLSREQKAAAAYSLVLCAAILAAFLAVRDYDPRPLAATPGWGPFFAIHLLTQLALTVSFAGAMVLTIAIFLKRSHRVAIPCGGLLLLLLLASPPVVFQTLLDANVFSAGSFTTLALSGVVLFAALLHRWLRGEPVARFYAACVLAMTSALFLYGMLVDFVDFGSRFFVPVLPMLLWLVVDATREVLAFASKNCDTLRKTATAAGVLAVFAVAAIPYHYGAATADLWQSYSAQEGVGRRMLDAMREKGDSLFLMTSINHLSRRPSFEGGPQTGFIHPGAGGSLPVPKPPLESLRNYGVIYIVDITTRPVLPDAAYDALYGEWDYPPAGERTFLIEKYFREEFTLAWRYPLSTPRRAELEEFLARNATIVAQYRAPIVEPVPWLENLLGRLLHGIPPVVVYEHAGTIYKLEGDVGELYNRFYLFLYQ